MGSPIDSLRTPYSTRGDPFYGTYLNAYQLIGGVRHQYDPTQNYYLVDGSRHQIGGPQGRLDLGNLGNVAPAPTPPHFQFTFDTIGQTIVRSFGHCRLLIHPIWALGINESGDTSVSNTQTFAGAVCAPIDQSEEGEIASIWESGSLIFNSGSAVTPSGWTPADAALLAASLAGVLTFPGNESQLPAAPIVADKGPNRTNAFRGIRYFIFPNYPIRQGGLPQLSVAWQRNNTPDDPDSGAVEFLAGDS